MKRLFCLIFGCQMFELFKMDNVDSVWGAHKC